MAICDHVLCTGCAACANACPISCIKMQPDSEGFLHPKIDECRCVHCHICEKSCPINQTRPISSALACFAARIKSMIVLDKSTSGGVFAAIATKVLMQGGYVCGCHLVGANQVLRHCFIHSVDELPALLGVKYIQSEIGNCYRDVIRLLKDGSKVFFCGTPCQVAALNNLVIKDKERLLTAQIICQGVPSPDVWRRYLGEQQTSLKSVIFRNKCGSWRHSKFTKCFDDGTASAVDLHEDGYLRLFLHGLDLRPSCYGCHFHENKAGADFTISDFWGIEKLPLGFSDDAGVSAVMIHSDCGLKFWNELQDEVDQKACTQMSITASNPRYLSSFPRPAERKFCMENYQKLGVTRVAEIVLDGRYGQKRAYRNFKQWAKSIIGWKVK